MPDASRWTPGRLTRLFVGVVCVIAIIGLFAGVLRQTQRTTARDAAVAGAERRGVIYLHPLTALIGQLVETQSAAVRGGAVDVAAVHKALAGVATADAQVGRLLRADQRFADLRLQVESALSQGSTGRTAYQAYTDLVALAVDLARRIGDASHLIHDQDLDSYYVMDAALVRLPDAMVYAGRAADLVGLAGDKELSGDDAIRAAVARYGVATAAEQVNVGLNKSVDTTSRASLGTNIARQLDAFRAAVDSFSPPTMLAQLAGSVNAATLAAAAHQVFAAALPLAHKLLSELDALLAERQEKIAADRRFDQLATGAAALAGLVLLLVATIRTRSRGGPPTPAGGGIPGMPEDTGEVSQRSLADARQLLGSTELVNAGRASSRPRGR